MIRTIRETDAPAVAALAAQLGYPMTAEEGRERIRLILEDSEGAVFVAETDAGAVAGWVYVFGAHRLQTDPFAEIGGLIVDEAQRSKGIGTALMETAQSWARARGYAKVLVRSNVIRSLAHEFYRKLGFNQFKTQAIFSRSIGPGSEASPGPFGKGTGTGEGRREQ
ncbi:MAG TPA: GNAT family N-acetyltransferase [Candidatus Bathyarchaeia archaeon]|nr:GNAT family N-acetyltransferase [Candidatus Bathyarchaeia archaeon]